VLAQLQAEFPDDLRIIFRHFPLSGHDKANLAAQAAEAAGLQGMFWEMHDLLYEKQPEWSVLSPAEFEDWLGEQAAGLGLNANQFAEDLNSPALVAIAEEAFQHGIEMGLPGTPYLLMNGESLPATFYGFEPLSLNLKFYAIPLGRLAKHQFTECPQITIDPEKQYTATLHTEIGDVVIALFADVAPFAVNNFIFLAEHDFYDNVTFHRVIPGFMAQGGDPSGTGLGNPGYFFSIEVSPGLTFNRAGLVALANAGPTSNGSQFFITYGPAEHLNGSFTIFGEVLEGMDVVEKFTPRDPDQNPFAEPGTLILDVTIEVK
jgi:cyclophilin family peptidyl-prolyl cis-trans isomerase